MDRGHGRAVLALSAAGGTVGLLLPTQITAVWPFGAAWAWLGLTMAGGLYDACFAYVTRTFPDRARPIVTRIAPFAGCITATAAAPTVAALLRAQAG